MTGSCSGCHRLISRTRGLRDGCSLACSHLWRTGNLGEVFAAPTDVVLSDTDTVEPDLLFISRERMGIVTRLNVQGAPDLVVEIHSPATAQRDLTAKRELYARHGVKEYWPINPDTRTVTVLLLRDGDYVEAGVYREGDTVTSPTLEGFSFRVEEIFPA